MFPLPALQRSYSQKSRFLNHFACFTNPTKAEIGKCMLPAKPHSYILYIRHLFEFQMQILKI